MSYLSNRVNERIQIGLDAQRKADNALGNIFSLQFCTIEPHEMADGKWLGVIEMNDRGKQQFDYIDELLAMRDECCDVGDVFSAMQEPLEEYNGFIQGIHNSLKGK